MPVLRFLRGRDLAPRDAALAFAALLMVVFLVAFAAGTVASRAGEDPGPRTAAGASADSGPGSPPRIEPVAALPVLRVAAAPSPHVTAPAPQPVTATVTTPPATAANPPPEPVTVPPPVRRPVAPRAPPPVRKPAPAPPPPAETFDSSG
jgi:hypothetical protein